MRMCKLLYIVGHKTSTESSLAITIKVLNYLAIKVLNLFTFWDSGYISGKVSFDVYTP